MNKIVKAALGIFVFLILLAIIGASLPSSVQQQKDASSAVSSANSELQQASSSAIFVMSNFCNATQNYIRSVNADLSLPPQQKQTLIANATANWQAEYQEFQNAGVTYNCDLSLSASSASSSQTSPSTTTTAVTSTTQTAGVTTPNANEIDFAGPGTLVINGAPSAATYDFNMTWQNFTVTWSANPTNSSSSFFWSFGIKSPQAGLVATSPSGDGLNGTMTFTDQTFPANAGSRLTLIIEAPYISSWTVEISKS